MSGKSSLFAHATRFRSLFHYNCIFSLFHAVHSQRCQADTTTVREDQAINTIVTHAQYLRKHHYQAAYAHFNTYHQQEATCHHVLPSHARLKTHPTCPISATVLPTVLISRSPHQGLQRLPTRKRLPHPTATLSPLHHSQNRSPRARVPTSKDELEELPHRGWRYR